jgi:pimeloyl-ACP methyl ester carboxylesterase
MSIKIKRAFFDAEDGQILYRIGGEGSPLLFLPMTPRSGEEFRALMSILASQYLVIAMDLMGLGDSDRPPYPYSVQDYAKTVIALLDQLDIGKTSIFGDLTGGYIGGEVAVTYPERVEKVIFCNVHKFEEEESAKVFDRYAQGYRLKEDGSHLLERWLARSSYVSLELNHRCVLDELKIFNAPIYTGMAVAKYAPSASERFRSIRCPSLVLSGEKALEPLIKAGLAKREHQDWLSQVLVNSYSIELAGGTLCMVDQMPEEIAKILLDFLGE